MENQETDNQSSNPYPKWQWNLMVLTVIVLFGWVTIEAIHYTWFAEPCVGEFASSVRDNCEFQRGAFQSIAAVSLIGVIVGVAYKLLKILWSNK